MNLNILSKSGGDKMPVHPWDRVINGVRQYCGCCYSTAAKKGRLVRQTDAYKYPLCTLCEGRMREGLIHYVHSNGTEAMIFEERCSRCRHRCDNDGRITPKLTVPGAMCAWAVLDRITSAAWSDPDSSTTWHQPDDIATRGLNGEYICPARCLRFTGKGDADGESREPPPPDSAGQLFFSDLSIPVEMPAAPVEATP